jgi:hypothetical protein
MDAVIAEGMAQLVNVPVCLSSGDPLLVMVIRNLLKSALAADVKLWHQCCTDIKLGTLSINASENCCMLHQAFNHSVDHDTGHHQQRPWK